MAVERRFQAVTMVLAAAGLTHERRALRLRVADLQAHPGDGALTLEFRLMAGAFATTVLRELLDVTGEALTMLEIIDHEVAREIRFARPPSAPSM